MTTNGDMPALPRQGALLDSEERESASGVQIVLQACGEDASMSASPVADSNGLQVFPTTISFQGSVNPPRQRFHVELKQGETTVVSWKQLVKDSPNNALTSACESPANVNPSHVTPPTKKAAGADLYKVPANRFGSVIADIERGIDRRYYNRVDSDEENEYAPMDDYYDTKDSFIDDTELDEYFHVDTIKPEHTGFFVSKRTLEKVDGSLPCPPLQPLSPPLVHLPKKRKNITKRSREMGEIPKKKVKVSLGLTKATSKTHRPIAPVVKTTRSILVKTCKKSVIPKPKKRVKSVVSLTGSILVKTSEQSGIPNPKKRVKPVLSERDSHTENTTRLSSACISRENVQELKGEHAKDVCLQDMKTETTNLVNSGVATCLAVDAEQLDGSSDDRQENLGSILGSIDSRRVDSHGLQNAVCPAKERRKEQKTVKMVKQIFRKKDDSTVKMRERNLGKKDASMGKMGEQNFLKKDDSMVKTREQNLRKKDASMVKMGQQNFRRKKDDSITDKHKTDRETASTGRKLPAPESRPTIVALLNKGVPQKENVIVKASKQGQDGISTGKRKGKRNHDTALGKALSREDARRILVELGIKHGMEFAKKMRLT